MQKCTLLQVEVVSISDLELALACLDPTKFWPETSHQIFGRMYRALNVEKKPIAQFVCKLRDESFKPNYTMI